MRFLIIALFVKGVSSRDCHKELIRGLKLATTTTEWPRRLWERSQNLRLNLEYVRFWKNGSEMFLTRETIVSQQYHLTFICAPNKCCTWGCSRATDPKVVGTFPESDNELAATSTTTNMLMPSNNGGTTLQPGSAHKNKNRHEGLISLTLFCFPGNIRSTNHFTFHFSRKRFAVNDI